MIDHARVEVDAQPLGLVLSEQGSDRLFDTFRRYHRFGKRHNGFCRGTYRVYSNRIPLECVGALVHALSPILQDPATYAVPDWIQLTIVVEDAAT